MPTTIDKYPASAEEATDSNIPMLCCTDCRTEEMAIHIEYLFVEGQLYYCPLCTMVWEVPVFVPSWWVREWRLSKASTVASALWMLLMLGTLIGSIVSAGYVIVINRWSENIFTMFGIIAASLCLWVIGITILGKIFALCEFCISWVYHYVRGETLSPE